MLLFFCMYGMFDALRTIIDEGEMRISNLGGIILLSWIIGTSVSFSSSKWDQNGAISFCTIPISFRTHL